MALKASTEKLPVSEPYPAEYVTLEFSTVD